VRLPGEGEPTGYAIPRAPTAPPAVSPINRGSRLFPQRPSRSIAGPQSARKRRRRRQSLRTCSTITKPTMCRRLGPRASGRSLDLPPDLQTPLFGSGGMLMRPNDGGIDDQIFEVRVIGHRLEYPPPNTLDAPSTEAPKHAVPIPTRRIANRDRLRPPSLTVQPDRGDVASAVMVLSEVASASC
jgi:hypothetical protein